MSKICRLEDIKELLNKDGYFVLGHGTGRAGNSNETIKSIFQNGLRTKDNSLYYTTIGLDASDINALKTKLCNWYHCDSKKVILIRIPIKYINVIGASGDLDGEKYGAFMIKHKESGRIINYLDPKFIVGCFDAENQYFEMNELFEETLTESSINKLIKQYKETLEKTEKRIKRLQQSMEHKTNDLSISSIYDTQLPDNFDFDDEIEWDTPEYKR